MAVCAKIDAVTAEDIVILARHFFKSDPSIGAAGHDLSKLPSYEVIRNYVRAIEK